jgi:hypothetical protein
MAVIIPMMARANNISIKEKPEIRLIKDSLKFIKL